MTRRLAPARGRPRDAQVEELLRVDLRDRGGVRAAHVVGEDLQAGDRVGVGRLDSSRLRDSWKASVCWAPWSTLIMPRQTADERPPRIPRKARSEVVCGAACSCGVSKSRCWRPCVRVGAGDACALGARARRASSPGRPCRSADRSRARPSRACRRARPRRAGCRRSSVCSLRSCAATKRSVGVLRRRRARRPSLTTARLRRRRPTAYCSHTSASAPSSSTTSSAPVAARCRACAWTAREHDRRLDAHAARHVDERAVGPLRPSLRAVNASRRPSTSVPRCCSTRSGVPLGRAAPAAARSRPRRRSRVGAPRSARRRACRLDAPPPRAGRRNDVEVERSIGGELPAGVAGR